MKPGLTEINLEVVLPRARDTVLNAVGNSFAVRLPWGGVMPRILEQKRDGFSFSLESLAIFSIFSDSGEMLAFEDGRKSRVSVHMNMRGSLLALYALHCLAALLAALVHLLLFPLFSEPLGTAGLLFVFFALLVWPLLIFGLLKLQQRRKLEIFLGNLIYYV